MAQMTDAQIQDLLEELVLLKSGKPYHVHQDALGEQKKRCSSPYCVDLTLEGVREHA